MHPMSTKQKILQLLGITGLLSGFLFGLLLLRRLLLWGVADAWEAIELILGCGLIAYVILLSIRGIRSAKDQATDRNKKVRWGRVYLGAVLIFIQVENRFHPAPNLLKPSSKTEATTMNALAIAVAFLGGWLVLSGILPRFKQNSQRGGGSKIVP